MKSIPVWALEEQRKLEKCCKIPRYKLGDIVSISPGKVIFSGGYMYNTKQYVAVIINLSLAFEIGNRPPGEDGIYYGVNSGNEMGYQAWINENDITLLKRSKD